MTTEPTTDMYMEFSNPGEVPLNAFKLLGASTKRNVDGKIGFFGTGLKYSVALMLREGIDFKAFIGLKEVKFGIRNTDFGGIKVGVITVNGEKTSLTTDAGIDWQPWFAIREIYSNALDEGGSMEITDDFQPEEGVTKIYIQMSDKLGDVSRNWQSYFAMKRESVEDVEIENCGSYRILPKREGKPGFTVFRHGIRVGEYHDQSLYDYDFSNIKINESRVVESDWESRQRAAEALARAESKDVISLFVSSWKQSLLEHEERFWSYLFDDTYAVSTKTSFSDTWLEVLKPYRIVPVDLTGFYGVTNKTVGLPSRLINRLYAQFGDQLNIEGKSKQPYRTVTEVFPEQFEQAYEVLSAGGFTYPKDQIRLAQFRDYDINGAYDSDNQLIVLAEKTTNWTDTEKVELLLHEMLHQESGHSDSTRQFEDFIIHKLADRIIESA